MPHPDLIKTCSAVRDCRRREKLKDRSCVDRFNGNDIMRSCSSAEDDCSPAASAHVRRLCRTVVVRPAVAAVPHHCRAD